MLSACASHAPASLSTAGVSVWQANRVALEVATLQRMAIGLNELEVCQPLCHPVLSTQNTRVVIEAAQTVFLSLRAVPQGWRQVGLDGLARMAERFDAAGRTQLGGYLELAHEVIVGLEP